MKNTAYKMAPPQVLLERTSRRRRDVLSSNIEGKIHPALRDVFCTVATIVALFVVTHNTYNVILLLRRGLGLTPWPILAPSAFPEGLGIASCPIPAPSAFQEGLGLSSKVNLGKVQLG